MHGETSVVLQSIKYCLPRLRKALMSCTERILEYYLGVHAAIIRKIATNLQK